MERRGFLASIAMLMGWQVAKQPDNFVGSQPKVCVEGGPCYPELPCKEGKEHCPLGHCQKPRHRMLTGYQYADKPTRYEYDSVCSECGIVYVIGEHAWSKERKP
jgi:hypothetical protein